MNFGSWTALCFLDGGEADVTQLLLDFLSSWADGSDVKSSYPDGSRN